MFLSKHNYPRNETDPCYRPSNLNLVAVSISSPDRETPLVRVLDFGEIEVVDLDIDGDTGIDELSDLEPNLLAANLELARTGRSTFAVGVVSEIRVILF